VGYLRNKRGELKESIGIGLQIIPLKEEMKLAQFRYFGGHITRVGDERYLKMG